MPTATGLLVHQPGEPLEALAGLERLHHLPELLLAELPRLGELDDLVLALAGRLGEQVVDRDAGVAELVEVLAGDPAGGVHLLQRDGRPLDTFGAGAHPGGDVAQGRHDRDDLAGLDAGGDQGRGGGLQLGELERGGRGEGLQVARGTRGLPGGPEHRRERDSGLLDAGGDLEPARPRRRPVRRGRRPPTAAPPTTSLPALAARPPTPRRPAGDGRFIAPPSLPPASEPNRSNRRCMSRPKRSSLPSTWRRPGPSWSSSTRIRATSSPRSSATG